MIEHNVSTKQMHDTTQRLKNKNVRAWYKPRIKPYKNVATQI
jgi:hypothetical protein